ncbi:MAG TPA: ATP-binding protein, partial [Gemmatimonadaceae bacterium]|nr:ATP-binding protein [Gemmatimonadaceae bacterium]
MFKRQTLPRAPWIATFAAVAAIIMIAATLLYRREAQRVTDELYENLEVVGSLKSVQIRHWREERAGDATTLAASPTVQHAAASAATHPERIAADSDFRAIVNVMAAAFTYSNVLLVSPDGRVLFTLQPADSTLGPNTRLALDSAAAVPTPVLSNLFRGTDGLAHVDVAHAVRDRQGRTLAVLLLRTSTGTYLNPLMSSWPSARKTTGSFLLRRDGDDVIVLKDQVGPGDVVATVVPLSMRSLAPVAAALGVTGRFAGEDHRRVRVLADLRRVTDAPWFIISKIDESEVHEVVWLRARAIPFVAGLLVLLSGAVTAYAYRDRQNSRLRALWNEERRAREAQAVFRTTFYSIGDAVITTDLEQRVTAMNRVAEQLTGWTDAEARGKPLGSIYHTVDEDTRVPRNPLVVAQAGSGESTGFDNHTLLLGRTHEYPIASTAATIRDDVGAAAGAVVIFRDETAHRHQQAVLLREERMASMGRLAGGVAHDFNNLLSIIMNATELVMTELPGGGSARADLEEVQRACDRATALTRQLLTFSKRQVVKPQPVDVSSLALNMQSMLVRLLGRRASLALDCAPGVGIVLADPVQIEQVLMNLVINARDAMPNGGTITVATRETVLDAPLDVASGTLPAGRYVMIEVRDPGSGMDAATQRRVFEPFFTTKPAGEGTGLGLATVHGIVQRAGGAVSIASEPGHGTTF